MSKVTDNIIENLEQTGRNLIKQQIEYESMNSVEAEQLLNNDPAFQERLDESEKDFIETIDRIDRKSVV